MKQYRRHQGNNTTFPHCPDVIRSNPFAKSPMGNVCVTTGLMLSPALNSPASLYQVLNSRHTPGNAVHANPFENDIVREIACDRAGRNTEKGHAPAIFAALKAR